MMHQMTSEARIALPGFGGSFHQYPRLAFYFAGVANFYGGRKYTVFFLHSGG